MLTSVTLLPTCQGAASKVASCFVAAALSGLVAASSAHAATYTTPVTPSPGPMTHVDDPFFTFNVPGFNTSLGTLTGFVFNFNGTLTDTVFIPTVNQQPLIGTFTNSVRVNGDVNGNSVQIPLGSTVGQQTDSNRIGGTSGISFSTGLSPGFLASIAPGNLIDISLTVSGLLRLDPPNGLGASSQVLSLSQISISETFVYNPVPEPLSLALVASGLIGVAAVRRKQTL